MMRIFFSLTLLLYHWSSGVCTTFYVSEEYSLSVPYSEYDALFDIYESTSGERWVWNNRQDGIPWNFTGLSDPCMDEWQGVSCRCTVSSSVASIATWDTADVGDQWILSSNNGSTNCTVSVLDLRLHNMTGILPLSFSNLSSLEVINLARNHIRSPLPSTLAQLKFLTELNLDHNDFSEPLPPFLSNLTALTVLSIGNNFFSGQIPDSYFSFPRLLEFDISSNFLTTTLSPLVSNLTYLRRLDILDNLFFGSIPTTLKTMTNLTDLSIGLTGFSGGFPLWICDMTWLQELDMSYNDYSGTLPTEMANLTNLKSLYMGGNRFVSPFPTALFNLTGLEVLDLQDNYYTSSLPSSLGLLANMTALYLGNNMFGGSLPCQVMGSWPNLTVISVYENTFNGHIEKCFVNNSLLKLIALYSNMLSGPLPQIQSSWMGFLAYNNFLSGNLSTGFPSVAALQRYNIGNNLLTGSLPYQLLNFPHLFYLAVNDNLLTGSIQLYENATNSNLLQLFLDSNYFTGTIPPILVNYTNLVEIFLSENFLTGTVPVSLHDLKYLSMILVANNKLTGTLDSLYNPSRQVYMNNIDVSVNYFTGTIPGKLFDSPSLTSFAASSNCLHGTLPDGICSATNLLALVLDGASTASRCRHKLFPDLSSLEAFFVQDTLRGTIPECIFSDLHTLHTLHLSGNDFSGSISPDVHIMRGLADLTLSHNRFTGSVPLPVQMKFIPTLDLSFNRFSGDLSSEFVSLFDESSLYLQVNRISGRIPSSWKKKKHISVLEGNIFYCETDRSSLPHHDPINSIYICGSDEVNYSVYGWCFVFGCGFITLAIIAVRHWFNKESPSFNFIVRRLVESVSVASIVQPSSSAESIETLFALFSVIRQMFCILSLLMVVVLMPTYSSLKRSDYTYTHQYGWQVSAVYLQGLTSSSVMIVLFGFILLCLLVCMNRFAARFSTLAKYGITSQKQNHLSSNADAFGGRTLALDEADKSLSSTMTTTKFTQKLTVKFIALSLINLFVMVGINAAYIYVFLNYSASVVTTMQIVMAIIKTLWNDIVLWQLTSYVRIVDDGAVVVGLESAAVRWRLLSSYQFSREDVVYVLLTTLVNNSLVPAAVIAFISSNCFYNAIIAAPPVTGQYGVFGCGIYVIIEFLDRPFCLHTHPVYIDIKYYPPFQYSYQCASTFYTNYIPVYVFMFIGVGLLMPAVKLLVHYYCTLHSSQEVSTRLRAWFLWIVPHLYTAPHVASQSDRMEPQVVLPMLLMSTEQRGSVLERRQSTRVSLCDLPLQEVVRDAIELEQRQSHIARPHPEPEQQDRVPEEAVQVVQQHRPPLLFKKEKALVQVVSYLSIAICFGIVYPPLAVIVCVAFITQSYTTQFLLVSMLRRCRAADVALQQHQPANRVLEFYSSVLGSQCNYAAPLLVALVHYLLPFAMLLLGYLIFDTAGYTGGWKDGVWSWILFCAWPIVILGTWRLFYRFKSAEYKRDYEEGSCEAKLDETVTPLAGAQISTAAKEVEMAASTPS